MSTGGRVPSDMCAVFDGYEQRFWVYFVSTQGSICAFKGPETGQREDADKNPQYNNAIDISAVGGDQWKSNPDSPRLAVVEYVTKDASGSDYVS